MQSIKLAVVGSRDIDDYKLVEREINKIMVSGCNVVEIISGGAKGVDTLAEKYASEHSIKMTPLKPDWSKGLGAGIERNADIINACDVVLAIWDGVSSGTRSSIKLAKLKNKKLIIVRPDLPF
jgi:hypothetical protein